MAIFLDCKLSVWFMPRTEKHHYLKLKLNIHTKLNLLFIITMAQVWPISTLIQFRNKLFQIDLRLTIIAVLICIYFWQVQKFERYSFLDLQVRLRQSCSWEVWIFPPFEVNTIQQPCPLNKCTRTKLRVFLNNSKRR